MFITLKPLSEAKRNPMPIGSTRRVNTKGKLVYELPLRPAAKPKRNWTRAERNCKARGLCADCYGPLGESVTTRCNSCKEKKNRLDNLRRQRYLAAGRCIGCGAGPLDTTRLCKKCADKMRLRGAVVRAARKAEGMCPCCGNEVERFKVCKPCRMKMAESSKKRRAAQRLALQGA